MKRKIFASIFCILIVLVSIFVPYIFRNNNTSTNVRYHQHLMAKLRPEDEVDDGTFNTHLPLICINTNDVTIPGKPIIDSSTGLPLLDEDRFVQYSLTDDGEEMMVAKMDVIDHNDRVNRPGDLPEISSDIQIRVRGRSSRHFDKSNYLIKLIDEEGNNRNEPLLGMDSHHEWALHGPFLDKTLIRNYMWYNISGEIMGYSPNVRFCEVILNGEYIGLYVLTETPTAGVKSGRLPISVSKKNEDYSGYLLRLDLNNNKEKIVDSFSRYTYRTKQTLELKYPGEDNVTDSMKESIRQDFSDFEKMLFSYDYDNWDYGYRNYINRQSFVDYFIINEFSSNYDADWLSTYMYKDIDGEYYMYVWDFNSACENYKHELQGDNQHFELQNGLWYNMLIKDEAFTNAIVNRYRDLRKTYLNDEYLNNYIDDVIDYLGPAIDRNYQVWGYTFEESEDLLLPTERNPRTYEEAVIYMKDTITIRGNWMDENIDSLLQYSNEAKVKKYNEKAN